MKLKKDFIESLVLFVPLIIGERNDIYLLNYCPWSSSLLPTLYLRASEQMTILIALHSTLIFLLGVEVFESRKRLQREITRLQEEHLLTNQVLNKLSLRVVTGKGK